MSKSEFLITLRNALQGNIGAQELEEHIQYYEDYINQQLRLGKSEEQVMEQLGDPRLIARTICDSSEAWEEESEPSPQREEYRQKTYSFRLPWWAWMLVAVLIMIAVISLVASVVSFLLPIILPIFVVLLLVKLFRDWLQ